jgi:hypothetical protein
MATPTRCSALGQNFQGCHPCKRQWIEWDSFMAGMILLPLMEFSMWRLEQMTSRNGASYVTGITRTVRHMMVNVEVSVGLQGISSLLCKRNTQLWKHLFLISVGKLYDNHHFSVVQYMFLWLQVVAVSRDYLAHLCVKYRRLVLN